MYCIELKPNSPPCVDSKIHQCTAQSPIVVASLVVCGTLPLKKVLHRPAIGSMLLVVRADWTRMGVGWGKLQQWISVVATSARSRAPILGLIWPLQQNRSTPAKKLS